METYSPALLALGCVTQPGIKGGSFEGRGCSSALVSALSLGSLCSSSLAFWARFCCSS